MSEADVRKYEARLNDLTGKQRIKLALGVGSNGYQVDGSHYVDMGIQPWEVMEDLLTHEEFKGYLKGCLIKYSMRAGKKESSPMDEAKYRHYRQKLDEILQNK